LIWQCFFGDNSHIPFEKEEVNIVPPNTTKISKVPPEIRTAGSWSCGHLLLNVPAHLSGCSVTNVQMAALAIVEDLYLLEHRRPRVAAASVKLAD